MTPSPQEKANISNRRAVYTFKFSTSRPSSKIFLKIKTNITDNTPLMAKISHFLDEILKRRYYQKEWIQDDLRALGSSPTGSKSELVYRLLNAFKKQGQNVAETSEYLISSLPSYVLKEICREFGLKIARKQEDLVGIILSSTEFEPYVDFRDRGCLTCKRVTEHEIHYDNDWAPDRFQCTICGVKTWIPNNPVSEKDLESENKGMDRDDSSVIWTLAGTGITEFTAVFLGLLNTFKLDVVILMSSIVMVITVVGLVFTKKYWEKPLIGLLRKVQRK